MMTPASGAHTSTKFLAGGGNSWKRCIIEVLWPFEEEEEEKEDEEERRREAVIAKEQGSSFEEDEEDDDGFFPPPPFSSHSSFDVSSQFFTKCRFLGRV